MATYFHGGAEIQAAGGDNLQTLYLMNPNYITTTAYSENHHHNHHQLILNPTVTPNTLTQGTIPHHPSPHQHHQLIGIPLSGPHHSTDLSRPSYHLNSDNHNHNQITSNIQGLAGSTAHYNLWSPTSERSPAQPGPIHDCTGQAAARGGLSLSLSPGQRGHHRAGVGGEDVRMSVTVASGPGSSNGPLIGSKYLRATQELLEEVVNVGGGDNGESSGVHKNNNNKAKVVVNGGDDDVAGGGDGGGERSKKVAELTTAQRHELQMKKAKLLNMLDEVEQRYRQYHTEMQILASSFEQAAGVGSAKSYTSLALKTISKQFRCLKDAITSQIKTTNKSLGEGDNNGGGVKLEGGAGSRLRLVDQQIRQHRALQQLGMMQHSHNAWRPQRGLPERAVSVLRAWLFEHFLHPYPKDSDKHMLAKQTGLTRSQVSNWFINARVRLWKPMVEEMYVEEMKSQEQNGVTSEDNTNTTTATTTNNGGMSKNELNQQDHSTTNKTTITPQQHEQEEEEEDDNGGFNMIQTHQNHDHNNHQITNDMISSLSAMSTTSSQGFTLIGSSSDMESFMVRSQQKKQRSNNSDINSPSSILSMDMEIKPIDHQHHHQRNHHSSMMSTHGGAGFNPYIINTNNNNDIGRFNPNHLTTTSYHGNAVSLTLGLPHSENHHQQNFFPNQGMDLGTRLEIGPSDADFCGSSMAQTSHPSNVYQSIDIQSRKRFAAQILHDFVA